MVRSIPQARLFSAMDKHIAINKRIYADMCSIALTYLRGQFSTLILQPCTNTAYQPRQEPSRNFTATSQCTPQSQPQSQLSHKQPTPGERSRPCAEHSHVLGRHMALLCWFLICMMIRITVQALVNLTARGHAAGQDNTEMFWAGCFLLQ